MPHTPPDPRSPKDAWDEQHGLLAGNPVAWALKADELISAFEILVTEFEERAESAPSGPRFSSVALMLGGFAIEVLLKGLLVQKEAPINTKGKFIYGSHHLIQLAEDAELPLSEDERRLLEKLEEFLTWAGRYPISLESGPMRPRKTPSGGFAPRTYGNPSEDWPAIRTLIEKLRQLSTIGAV